MIDRNRVRQLKAEAEAEAARKKKPRSEGLSAWLDSLEPHVEQMEQAVARGAELLLSTEEHEQFTALIMAIVGQYEKHTALSALRAHTRGHISDTHRSLGERLDRAAGAAQRYLDRFVTETKWLPERSYIKAGDTDTKWLPGQSRIMAGDSDTEENGGRRRRRRKTFRRRCQAARTGHPVPGGRSGGPGVGDPDVSANYPDPKRAGRPQRY